jgi:hypothetical protein
MENGSKEMPDYIKVLRQAEQGKPNSDVVEKLEALKNGDPGKIGGSEGFQVGGMNAPGPQVPFDQELMHSETIKKIKELRRRYNSFLYGLQVYDKKSRALTMVYDAAENARSWWGKILGILGNPYPYGESNNPASTVIEPMADDSGEIEIISDLNEIAVIKRQRAKVSEQIEICLDMYNIKAYSKTAREVFTYQGLFYALNQYSIALGLRLGEIREEMEEQGKQPESKLSELARQLCYEIEKFPAGEQQKKVSVIASELNSLLNNGRF